MILYRACSAHGLKVKGKVCIRAKWPIKPVLIPGFRSMKRLGVFLLPPDGMLVHHRVTPSSKFAGTHLYTWVERGTMRVKCLAQEHNAVPRPGLEPGPPDPESSALTVRPPRVDWRTRYIHAKRACFVLWIEERDIFTSSALVFAHGLNNEVHSRVACLFRLVD